MAWAFVINAKISGTNGGTTPAVNATGADTLFSSVEYYDGVTADPLTTDSLGNTWTALTSYHTGGGGGVKMGYAKNATVSSSMTFTLTGSVTFAAFTAAAFSGGDLTAPFDQLSGQAINTNGTTYQPGSITPAGNNYLLVTGLNAGNNTAAPVTIGSGFTITDTFLADGSTRGCSSMAYLIQGSAAAVNPTWTWPNTDNRGATMASFKPAGAAPSGKTTFNTNLDGLSSSGGFFANRLAA